MFEGKTLLPVLRRIASTYDFGKPIVVADAAMLSKDNLKALDRHNYPFIVAARNRNESRAMQAEILRRCQGLQNGQSVEINKPNGHRLIVTYSAQRAKKDAHNRVRGFRRLRKRIGGGQLTKEQLNNRGYNGFLKLTGKVTVELDEAQIEQAVRWHGLKGYLTNTDLPGCDVIENYGQLWHVELDIRAIKQTLGLDHVRCKSPDMVRRELWVTLLAYNLVRKLIATAAAVHGKQARQLGFTLACQTILSSWMLVATGVCRNASQLWRLALERIAANKVANRPGRIEPRMIKRRRDHYPLMHDPRWQLRAELMKT